MDPHDAESSSHDHALAFLPPRRWQFVFQTGTTGMNWTPHIEGTLPIHAPNSQFIAALGRRIENGLLTGQRGARSNYEMIQSSTGAIRVRAVDWWTAINVGLNDLDLDFPESGRLHFRVVYWRWATYCLLLCSFLGLVGVAFFLAFDIRSYIAENRSARLPGLSIDQNLYFAWANLLFWGFVWPWILITLHKRPLRRLLAKLVTEIDAKADIEVHEAG